MEDAKYVTYEVHNEFAKRIEDENTRQNHRISDLEENVKQIQELTVSVREMAVNIGQMTRELSKQGERLEAIEKEPAQNWKQASWIVIALILGALVTLALTKIGL